MTSHAPELFDTHVHLDLLGPKGPLAEALRPAREAGVGRFLVPGVRPEGWPRLLETVRRVEGALAAPGLHPLAAGEWGAQAAARLAALLEDPAVAAVGEIGLDRFLEEVPQDLQERAFREQLRLAVDAALPVLIHCRRATGRTLAILREEGAQRVGGLFHAFSGSLETALECVKLGFAIGFGGPLTYPGARRGPELLRSLPEESIVLETDAPDLPPHPHRGGENRPEYLTLIAAKVGEIRGWTAGETARITTANARRVLGIGER